MDADCLNLELHKTISHLAKANQQLAEAHNLTLNNVQCFLNEYRKVQSTSANRKRSLQNFETKKVKKKLKVNQNQSPTCSKIYFYYYYYLTKLYCMKKIRL